MSKKALLLSGFLSENDIKNVQDNVTGDYMDLEALKSILAPKSENPVSLSYTPGKPQIDFIDKKYATILNDYNLKYKNASYFPQVEWSYKSVEICPLLCDAVFLDLDKINYFQGMFSDNNYENFLHICLDVQEPKVNLKIDNKGLTFSSDNPDIIGLGINQNLQIVPQITPTPVIVAQIYDRYILFNGKHRAVALCKAGYDKIPAVVFNSTNPYIMQPGYRFHHSTLLKESPPTIGHYMNENFISEVLLINNLNVYRIIIDKSTIQI